MLGFVEGACFSMNAAPFSLEEEPTACTMCFVVASGRSRAKSDTNQEEMSPHPTVRLLAWVGRKVWERSIPTMPQRRVGRFDESAIFVIELKIRWSRKEELYVIYMNIRVALSQRFWKWGNMQSCSRVSGSVAVHYPAMHVRRPVSSGLFACHGVWWGWYKKGHVLV